MIHTPFSRGIATDALYQTHQSAEVLSRLIYAAKRQQFALLCGEPGTGKTTTLRRLRDELPGAEYIVLYISDSKLTPRSFYNYLLNQLGCKSETQRSSARGVLHHQIEIMRSIYAAQSLQNNIDSRTVDIVLQNEVTGVYAK